MFTTMRAALAALAIAAPGVIASSGAHEGHDHGAPAPLVPAAIAPRAEASSDLFELVAAAKGDELIVHLDRFLTNEPVEGATVEVETPEGPRVAEVSGDFYRLPASWVARPGRHDLIFTVTAGTDVDVLTATLVVPEPATAPPGSGGSFMAAVASDIRAMARQAAARGAPFPTLGIAAVGGFVVGVAFAWLVGRRRVGVAAILLAVAGLGSAAAHEGHDHGAGTAAPANATVAQRLPDGAIFVPKPTQRILAIRTLFTETATHATTIALPGRIIPDPNASGHVQAAVAGRLSPPPDGFPRLGAKVAAGDVLAFVQPPLTAAEGSDQRQRQGELDQQIAIVERRIERFAALVRTGASTRVQLDESRLELQGLRDRRAALDRVRRDPEPLVAPVDGRIAAANVVAGKIAEPGAILFQIVDPTRLWVEALSFAPLSMTGRATARDAQGRVLALIHEGTGIADRNQAIPVHLSIVGDTSGLRLGQLVTVLVETTERRDGVVVPRTSVLRGANGQALVYEHVAAERFEPREVRVEPLDGERALIAAGLGRGRRVVAQGAELLDQIR